MPSGETVTERAPSSPLPVLSQPVIAVSSSSTMQPFGVGLLGQITGCRKRHRGNDYQRKGTCSRCNEKARGPASRTRRSYTLAPNQT